MAYRTYRRARPQPRSIIVKYAAACHCCGAEIKAGELADYYPVGTIANEAKPRIAHRGGLDGTSARCSAEIRKHSIDPVANDFAGDGLDARYEDQCRDICERGM